MSLLPTFPCEALPSDARLLKLLGVYPQRQDGLYMQRIRVLGGRLTAGQWRALAAAAREHTPHTPLHLTTRQDVEFHDLAPRTVPLVQQEMTRSGLTGLGACGDTFRNITVCPCSGLACVELEPLAQAIARELEAYDQIYSLPRKFKVSLSGAPQCGQPYLHDLAFVAQAAGGRPGFRVVGAGSLGARPALGIVLREWAAPEEVLPISLAAVRLFARAGDRENRTKARLRHVRQRLGDAEFLRQFEAEVATVVGEKEWPAVQLSRPPQPMQAKLRLVFANGDLWPEAAEALADLIQRHGLHVRIDVHHQVWVFAQAPADLDIVRESEALCRAAAPQPAIVACPGTRWCSRAVVDTAGLADRIRRELGTVLPADATVCISGCANGCAQSAVADFGLSGRLGNRDGKRVELFNLVQGGDHGRGPQLARPAGEQLAADQVIERLALLSRKG